MKIPTTTVLKTLDGEPLKFPAVNGHEAENFTLRRACVEALMVPREADTGDAKVTKYRIALAIQHDDLVELVPEEIALVKKAVGEWGGPLIVGQAFALLNG
jgi:hypothetical protein